MNRRQKIEDALSRSVCGGWDRSFLESILEQTAKGRDLTTKQKQTLGKVLARNDDVAQEVHENWTAVYETQYKAAALILGSYHTRQPYYRPMAADILAGKVPERNKFLRMYENKYSKKVLSQHAATPKYQVGQYVRPRATFNSYKHMEFVNDVIWTRQNSTVQNFNKKGGFVMEICEEIYSCANGAKRYKLLPVGETMPVIVEERFLKKAKAKK